MHESVTTDRLAQELAQRERELDAVYKVTRALLNPIEIDELLREALVTTMETLEADAGSLLLHDSEQRKLVFHHVEGPARDTITGMAIADTQGIAGEVFQCGEPRINLDVTKDPAHILDVDEAARYTTRTMITVPLHTGAHDPIGVMQLLNKHTGEFDDDDLAVAQVIASQVSAAIVNTRLHEQARAAVLVDMLGQITHDIKNLLTPVSMAGQTLRVMLDDLQSQVADEMAQPLHSSEERLARLAEMTQRVFGDVSEIFAILDESTTIAQQRAKEIADAVRGFTAPVSFELLNVSDIIAGVVRVLELVASQHKVTLRHEAGEVPRCLLDGHRMYNAIYNLTNNAIGATPEGGSVTLTTGCESGETPGEQFLRISVVDTGVGMPPDIAAILFSGKVRSTKPGGTGLGTRVVRNVVEAHEGQLSVESREGVGTTITIRIPLRQS
jgi:signal transduction histidine kinase